MPVELLDAQPLNVMMDFAPLLKGSAPDSHRQDGTPNAGWILGGPGLEGRRQRRIGVLLPRDALVADLKGVFFLFWFVFCGDTLMVLVLFSSATAEANELFSVVLAAQKKGLLQRQYVFFLLFFFLPSSLPCCGGGVCVCRRSFVPALWGAGGGERLQLRPQLRLPKLAARYGVGGCVLEVLSRRCGIEC